MKKILLGLGTVAAVVVPVVAVVSCAKDNEGENNLEPKIPGTIIANLHSAEGIKMKHAMEATSLFDTLTKAMIVMPSFPITLPQEYTFEGIKDGKKIVLFEYYSLGESIHLRKINEVELSQTKTSGVYDDLRNIDFGVIMDALQDNDEFFSMG